MASNYRSTEAENGALVSISYYNEVPSFSAETEVGNGIEDGASREAELTAEVGRPTTQNETLVAEVADRIEEIASLTEEKAEIFAFKALRGPLPNGAEELDDTKAFETLRERLAERRRQYNAKSNGSQNGRHTPKESSSAGTELTQDTELFYMRLMLKQEKQLFDRVQTGDTRAREILIEANMPLARHLANKYASKEGEPRDDIEQVAYLGLIKAVDRFDASRGLAFSSFAVPTIAGEIKRYYRDYSWVIRVTRNLQERTLAVQKIVDNLLATGQKISPVTIAQVMEISEDDAQEILEVISSGARYTDSLDRPLSSDEESGTLVTALADPEGEAMYDQVLEKVNLRGLEKFLTKREAFILIARFKHGFVQREIAEMLGISQIHVSRTLASALEKLRAVSSK